jgi:hypothetical protein
VLFAKAPRFLRQFSYFCSSIENQYRNIIYTGDNLRLITNKIKHKMNVNAIDRAYPF